MPSSKSAKSKSERAEPSLASAVAALANLNSRIGSLDVFGNNGIGLSEWLFLSTLSRNPDLKAGGVGRRIGLTPQRAAQIVKSLASGGFVKVSPNSADPRKKDLAVTDAGAAACAKIEAEIGRRIAAVLAKKPKTVAQLNRMAVSLVKALSAKDGG